MSSIISGHDIYALQLQKNTDVTSHHTLIEVELRRKTLYEDILKCVKNWIFDHSERSDRKRLTEMQMSHLLLRYIFNKKATLFDSKSDPVFIIGKSSLARKQLERDLKNINLKGAEKLAEIIDSELESAATQLRSEKFRKDKQVTLSTSTDGKLIYRDRSQKDFNQLAQRYGPDYYNAAYALGLRYTYICLTGHGLARSYKEETERSPHDTSVCECFASAFNHYFDQYHSAFPDLEVFFGSRGSFFNINWAEQPSNMTYYVSPPYDESLIQLAVDHVFNALDNHLVSQSTFIFCIPGRWTNFSALDALKASSWMQDFTDYPKDKLPFIDYMATNEKDRIIYPTDTCIITLSTEIKKEKTQSIPSRTKKRTNEIEEIEDYNSKTTNETKKRKLD
ncbi:unnamed protein product [Adineta steineri]|uniref:PCIF1 WW domain-containing protein n=2 Tax=Adineta steineri TaxID=433720 RepID=A0A819QXG4_9BILA|nr:unnamed protein product [Adineta steineri]